MASAAERVSRPRRNPNTVRIIGGIWRGRKLTFADAPGLRPTPDRVRETLFNWLQGRIEGARCLDLFAGSGALGLEALSRGARTAVLLEANPVVAKHLRVQAAMLGAHHAQIEQIDALAYLDGGSQAFDVVFLDPPFDAKLWTQTATLLARNGWLAPNAFIYVESSAQGESVQFPEDWETLRDKTAGDVRYRLLRGPAASSKTQV